MTALRKIVLYSTNGVATPVQYAMIHALKTPETEIAAHREEYRKRRDLLVPALNDVGLHVRAARGGLLCFPECGKDSQEQPHRSADSAGEGAYRDDSRFGLWSAGGRPLAFWLRNHDQGN